MNNNIVNTSNKKWLNGTVPITVILISLNEAHNIDEVLNNIKGWAREVFLVDSYSKDETIDIALKHGINIIQRSFKGFGDQWNFALSQLPISSPWTMKMDPDERLTEDLKNEIANIISFDNVDGISFDRSLFFLNTNLNLKQEVLRIWKTNTCVFSDVEVNEHPIVNGKIVKSNGIMEHHDSPNLHHWFHKQNLYTTLEAKAMFKKMNLAETPNLFGTKLQIRMWFKSNFKYFPFRYFFLFLYFWIYKRAIFKGRIGFIWARLRTDVMKIIMYKYYEMKVSNSEYILVESGNGLPDNRVLQA
jgi:glycosyltransferase involved in cell wall biosynthesis